MGIINQTKMKNLQVSLPSKNEQQQIVDFLDYKTEQCDRFIANRQKQIELLNEQLHFKINQAITKGINSKVKFKPTDIKYVPEIPEHWDIRKFKSLTFILTCGVAATPEYVEKHDGVLFLSAQNVKPFRMVFDKLAYIKPELHEKLTRNKKPIKGDVLVTRIGGDSNIGDACVVSIDSEFSVYVSLTHIRPNKEILSEYIVYFFNTEYCYQLNHEGTVVAGGQGNLNVKNVERYRIPLPPVEEQKEIITYLDNYRKEIDNLISKYQKQIELMQEYRTALISQAVTGKIDVRDWKPQTK
jgi:type I restriction enzyme S subunit